MLLPLLLQITLARANVDNNEHSNTCTHAHVEFMVVSRFKQSFSLIIIQFFVISSYRTFLFDCLFFFFFVRKKALFFMFQLNSVNILNTTKNSLTQTLKLQTCFGLKKRKTTNLHKNSRNLLNVYFLFGLCSEI